MLCIAVNVLFVLCALADYVTGQWHMWSFNLNLPLRFDACTFSWGRLMFGHNDIDDHNHPRRRALSRGMKVYKEARFPKPHRHRHHSTPR